MNDYFSDIGFWKEGAGLGLYITGFLGSLALTLGAYALATRPTLPYGHLVAILTLLALAQLLLQAGCFLHLFESGVSRERLALFGAAALVIVILVSGSLWIMLTLNYRMGMTPSDAQMEQYMQDEGGF